jgi:hypothetical protein
MLTDIFATKFGLGHTTRIGVTPDGLPLIHTRPAESEAHHATLPPLAMHRCSEALAMLHNTGKARRLSGGLSTTHWHSRHASHGMPVQVLRPHPTRRRSGTVRSKAPVSMAAEMMRALRTSARKQEDALLISQLQSQSIAETLRAEHKT